MNATLRKTLILLVLIVPTLGLLGLAGYSQHAIQQERSFVLPIQGYDPRDPVFGHYFQFQIKWPWRAADPVTCHAAPQDCRVCLQDTPPRVTAAIIPAEPPQRCDALIGGIAYFSSAGPVAVAPADDAGDSPPSLSLTQEPRRLYIDERDGPWLDAYFRAHPDDFSLVVKIHKQTLHVQTLLIDGRPYRDVMREKPELIP